MVGGDTKRTLGLDFGDSGTLLGRILLTAADVGDIGIAGSAGVVGVLGVPGVGGILHSLKFS